MRFGPPARRRRLVSLTPMIDGVFLLLVFFMLASKFTTERSLALTGGAESAGASWDGAPRLLRRAGVLADQQILIRIEGETDVQRLTDALDALAGAGFSNPVLLP